MAKRTTVHGPLSDWAPYLPAWTIIAQPKQYDQTEGGLRLTVGRIFQDGPNEPRIYQEAIVDFTRETAREFAAKLVELADGLDE